MVTIFISQSYSYFDILGNGKVLQVFVSAAKWKRKKTFTSMAKPVSYEGQLTHHASRSYCRLRSMYERTQSSRGGQLANTAATMGSPAGGSGSRGK